MITLFILTILSVAAVYVTLLAILWLVPALRAIIPRRKDTIRGFIVFHMLVFTLSLLIVALLLRVWTTMHGG